MCPHKDLFLSLVRTISEYATTPLMGMHATKKLFFQRVVIFLYRIFVFIVSFQVLKSADHFIGFHIIHDLLPDTLSHHGQIKFKYKVVHHEKDLSNLKVDPLRVPKK